MNNAIFCWLPLLCQLWNVQGLSLNALVAQSSIYLQQLQGELQLQQVEHLETPDSLKLIVHGFLGSRSHSSIMPLRNGKPGSGMRRSNCI